MKTYLYKKISNAMQAFHNDEQGDFMSQAAIGAVGILLAGLVLSVMSNATQGSNGKGGLAGMLSSLMGGGVGKIASFLGM